MDAETVVNHLVPFTDRSVPQGRAAAAIPKVFGEVLRQQRKMRGISQETLAYRAGMDRAYVSRIERGKNQLTVARLFALAYGLEMPAECLIRLTQQSLWPDARPSPVEPSSEHSERKIPYPKSGR